jgi:hypothetical protein
MARSIVQAAVEVKICQEDAMRAHRESRGGRRNRPAPVLPAAALVLALALVGGGGAGEPGPPPGPKSEPARPGAVGPGDITFVDESADQPPAGRPAASPFATVGAIARQDAVPGYVELSTGLKVPGLIYTTRAARIRIYNLQREVYEYVPVPALKGIETAVEWERMDKEWRFKEAGNPEKIYSGREYPVRKVAYTLTLRNDHTITGHVLGAPLYVDHNGTVERFILHDRDKGPMGSTLAELKYVRRVAFGPEAYNRAVEELKARAEAAAKQGGAGGGPPKAAPKKL